MSRRADRLFAIVQLIRGRRLSTAQWLADRLEVSVRTVYRDVAALQAQGVPIEGEAGVGYRIARGFNLPPLMFTVDEARALAAAVRMAQAWLDPALALAAGDAMARIRSVLPAPVLAEADRVALHAPPIGLDTTTAKRLQALREAIETGAVVRLDYRDADARSTTREVRPLGCFYWGKVWTLAAWCETRADFRSFRIDRIAAMRPAGRRFAPQPGRTLADLLRRVAAEASPRRGET